MRSVTPLTDVSPIFDEAVPNLVGGTPHAAAMCEILFISLTDLTSHDIYYYEGGVKVLDAKPTICLGFDTLPAPYEMISPLYFDLMDRKSFSTIGLKVKRYSNTVSLYHTTRIEVFKPSDSKTKIFSTYISFEKLNDS